MPDNEELFVSQSDRRILLPDRAGITDFDHYKSVLKKDNYNILKRIIENKYNNPFPQNIYYLHYNIECRIFCDGYIPWKNKKLSETVFGIENR